MIKCFTIFQEDIKINTLLIFKMFKFYPYLLDKNYIFYIFSKYNVTETPELLFWWHEVMYI
jgi:hypothetical protein